MPKAIIVERIDPEKGGATVLITATKRVGISLAAIAFTTL
jgi:hypothetical protein